MVGFAGDFTGVGTGGGAGGLAGSFADPGDFSGIGTGGGGGVAGLQGQGGGGIEQIIQLLERRVGRRLSPEERQQVVRALLSQSLARGPQQQGQGSQVPQPNPSRGALQQVIQNRQPGFSSVGGNPSPGGF